MMFMLCRSVGLISAPPVGWRLPPLRSLIGIWFSLNGSDQSSGGVALRSSRTCDVQLRGTPPFLMTQSASSVLRSIGHWALMRCSASSGESRLRVMSRCLCCVGEQCTNQTSEQRLSSPASNSRGIIKTTTLSLPCVCSSWSKRCRTSGCS